MNELSLQFDPTPAILPTPYNGRLPSDFAQSCALRLVDLLQPVCSRIEIGGSLRRRQMLVSHIELVCIENQPGAVRDKLRDYKSKKQIVNFWSGKNIGNRILRFTDISPCSRGLGSSLIPHPSSLVPIPVSIHLSSPDYFGWTLFISTGSRDWNLVCMRRLHDLGYRIKNNMITSSDTLHPSSFILHPSHEESSIFQLLGIPYVEPHLRHDKLSLQRALFQVSLQRSS